MDVHEAERATAAAAVCGLDGCDVHDAERSSGGGTGRGHRRTFSTVRRASQRTLGNIDLSAMASSTPPPPATPEASARSASGWPGAEAGQAVLPPRTAMATAGSATRSMTNERESRAWRLSPLSYGGADDPDKALPQRVGMAPQLANARPVDGNSTTWPTKATASAGALVDAPFVRPRNRSRSRSQGEHADWWHGVVSQLRVEEAQAHATPGHGRSASPSPSTPPADVPTGGSRSRAGSLGWLNPFRHRAASHGKTPSPTSTLPPPLPHLGTLSAVDQREPPMSAPAGDTFDTMDMRDLMRHMSESISLVRDYLMCCGHRPAANLAMLQQHGITHVVNAAGGTVPNFFEEHFCYMRLYVHDRDERMTMEEMMSLFYPVTDFIDEARRVGGRVLVHCHQGISRSSTLVLAYLLLREGVWPLEEAVRQMIRARPMACPNTAFLDALSEMELRVYVGRCRSALRQGLVTVGGKGSAIPPSQSERGKEAPMEATITAVNPHHHTNNKVFGWDCDAIWMSFWRSRSKWLPGGRRTSTTAQADPRRLVGTVPETHAQAGDASRSLAALERAPSSEPEVIDDDEVQELLRLRLFRLDDSSAWQGQREHRGIRSLLFRTPAARAVASMAKNHHGRGSGGDDGARRASAAPIPPRPPNHTHTSTGLPGRTTGTYAFLVGRQQRRLRVTSDRCYVMHTPFTREFLELMRATFRSDMPASLAASDGAHAAAVNDAANHARGTRHRRSMSISAHAVYADNRLFGGSAAVAAASGDPLGDTRLFVWCGARASARALRAALRLAWNIAVTECTFFDSYEDKCAIWDAFAEEMEHKLAPVMQVLGSPALPSPPTASEGHGGQRTRRERKSTAEPAAAAIPETTTPERALGDATPCALLAVPGVPICVVYDGHEPEEFLVHLHRTKSLLGRIRWFGV
ncbi:hypothetical protein CDCA_CDCA01G0450 [Cyanidium caldarium]|uniref:Dual specificity protein phosphatase n=1 Tax=Cyanidium caldarium TaxID=2771 RepID=A0AAV9IQ60_CYACA|nr:hypothetical protein CDCA_CDCA01G0450 [Cyanidium caldarium]